MSNLLTSQDIPIELASEAIAIRVRWFGLCVGIVLVNFVGDVPNQAILNAILVLGGVYAILDTWYSFGKRVFLENGRLFISLMEATFIGLLCLFDDGLASPFRFYYFLSLLVCAMRYPSWMTYVTLVMHIVSYSTVALTGPLKGTEDQATLLFLITLMAWMTWACTSLSAVLSAARERLTQLNRALQQNQALLEDRISERTAQLQQSQAMLVQHEKQAAFGLLAAGIAHEVGNPLAAISSLVQLLNRREIDGVTREKLHLVDDQLRRIQRTLRELIDFSRPASSLETSCDLHAVINEALSIAKYYKRKKGRRIVTAFATGLPNINIVRDEWVQVFLNLVLNAMDATIEGGTIKIETSLAEGVLRVAISDDGSGIEKAHQAHIFEPYFTTKETGTGLGLFVCRNMIAKAGGTIELTESSPAGTTFTVLLLQPGLVGVEGSLADRKQVKALVS